MRGQRVSDADIVEWIGRQGAAGASHVAARFGICRNRAYLRLLPLAREGLLEGQWILRARPMLYVASARGLRWRGLGGLGVCRLGAARFEHAWQIAEAVCALGACLPEWRLLSEREIAWRERGRAELLASVRVGVSGGSARRLHRPDLALVSPAGRVVAIEVELTAKEPSRLRAICNGWARARHVDAVYYLALPEAERAVGRAVRRTRAEGRITILPLDQTAEVARLERGAASEPESRPGGGCDDGHR